MSLCVVHLATVRTDENGCDIADPSASAFIVGGRLPREIGSVCYVVTARHVVEKARRSLPSTIFVRVNIGTGSYRDLPTHPDDWTCHPTTDVAVWRLPLTPDMEQDGFIVDLFVNDDSAITPQLGDPVVFMGLFLPYPGRQRNIPVVRFGNVSRVLEPEKIPVDLEAREEDDKLRRLTPVDAYLVEARSWGGQSGSPAFLFWPQNVRSTKRISRQHGPWLLGVVHGHCEIEQPVTDTAGRRDFRVPMNAGMAIVIPASAIMETLEMPHLEEERERLAREIEEDRDRKAAPKPD